MVHSCLDYLHIKQPTLILITKEYKPMELSSRLSDYLLLRICDSHESNVLSYPFSCCVAANLCGNFNVIEGHEHEEQSFSFPLELHGGWFIYISLFSMSLELPCHQQPHSNNQLSRSVLISVLYANAHGRFQADVSVVAHVHLSAYPSNWYYLQPCRFTVVDLDEYIDHS